MKQTIKTIFLASITSSTYVNMIFVRQWLYFNTNVGLCRSNKHKILTLVQLLRHSVLRSILSSHNVSKINVHWRNSTLRFLPVHESITRVPLWRHARSRMIKNSLSRLCSRVRYLWRYIKTFKYIRNFLRPSWPRGTRVWL